MGLRPAWVKVADAVGFDNFMVVWQTLSANQELLDARNRISTPSIETYVRFQRNNLIRSMASAGSTAKDICEELKRTHGIELSQASVNRVLLKMRE